MLGVLGDEWTLLVIQQALLGATRYGDFMARLPISNSVLTRRLRTLSGDGLLERRAYQSNPPRSEYLVTPQSRSLWPVLLSIWEWERHWVPDHAERLPRYAPQPRVVPTSLRWSRAAHVGTTTSEKDVVAQWGPSGSWPRSMPVTSTRRRSDGDRTTPPPACSRRP